MRHLPTLFCLLAASASAQTEVWVDSALGDDSNTGTSPSAPFRTISHAVSLDDALIHVQPGTYGAATGEVFPILLEGQDSIEAVDGPATTLLELPSTYMFPRPLTLEHFSSLKGMRLTQGGSNTTALRVSATGAVFEDVWIEGGATAVDSIGGLATFDRCRFEGQSSSTINWSTYGGFEMRESTISNSHFGIALYQFYENIPFDVLLKRCTITGCATGAVSMGSTAYYGGTSVRIEDSLFADCGGAAVSSFLQSDYRHTVTIEGTTIANCGDYGLIADPLEDDWTVSNCVITGHTVQDVVAPGQMHSCLISDGSGPMGTGNIVGDPMFVDSANGDYRLGWGSPAIDAGSDTSTFTDIMGRPRAVDGDLELFPRPDIGAFEHQTLAGPASAPLGQPFELEVTGPMGGFATVIVSHLGYAPFGLTTPYGRLFLNTADAYRLTPVQTLGLTSATVQVPAFTDPALIGTSTGFQALTRSIAAPAGGAFSQPILVAVE